MAAFTGEFKDDWWKWALAVIALIALYEGITGGISKALEKITDPFGVKDKIQEMEEKEQKALEETKKAIDKIKTPPDAQYQLGKTYEIAKANAKSLATIIYVNLKGVSGNDEWLKVYGIIKTLKLANDIKLLYKMFGIRDKQTLVQWIYNENMPDDMKQYMIKKIVAAINL